MADEVIGLLFGVEGDGVNGATGKIVVEGLTKIVNEINAGKSTVPKIKLDFDLDEYSKAADDLKNKLKEIASAASSVKIGAASGKGKSATKETQEQIQKYKDLSAAIKKWVQDSKTAAKLSEEYSGLSRNLDGSMSGTGKAEQYDKTVQSINATVEALKKLEFAFADADDASQGIKRGDVIRPNEKDFERIASEIGITEEQYRRLFEQMQTGATKAQQNVQNAHRTSQNAWDKQVRNVSQQIDQMYDTISKNPELKNMADDLRKYMQSGSGDVGDLKNRFDDFTRAVAKSGDGLETWGDQFKKTFAGKVRSALAAAITGAFTKYLREVYQNVVKIDKAMTDLQIASGKTREEVKELTKTYSDLAQQLGATTLEVAQGADTWLRQGYAAQEANTLIRNSTMLSKLGQMEAAEASTALTSAMKGYKVSVEESIGIVDKLTAVDIEAAASAGDIATAMAETAASAKIAGVSMDTLIGYIATVKEVTQDGAESVGTFFKTIFARMNNVKAGKFVDDETGESLNDVEKVLGKLGIALRDTNGEFRSSSAVLDEVGRKWSTYNSVQQHAIATAIAGTRQQEKLLVLFENYGDAINYANTATTSSNTAMEKYSAYTESIEGKLNTLTASFEVFSTTVLDTELVTFFLDVANGALTGLNAVAGFGDGVITTLGAVTVTTAVTTALIQTIIAKFGAKLASIFTALGTAMLNAFKNPLTYITILVSMFIAFQDKINGTWKIVIAAVAGISAALLTILVVSKIVANGISTAIMNIPIFGWIVAILQLVVTTIMAISGAINELKNNNKLREQALETAEAFQEQADAIREVSEAAKEATDSIHSLIEEFKDAQETTPSNPAEWLASIKEIGEEAAALFGDEQLSALQAINRLTDDQLTYSDLINMSLEQRIKLLKAIEDGSYDIAQQTAAEAYAAQKQASDQLTYALTAYGYDLENDNDTWTWGNLKNNQIDAAIDEAEEIAGRISGLSMSSNAGHDIDIKVDAGTLADYVNTLREAVDEYEERYKYNFGALSENAVYKYLSDSLTQAEASLNQQRDTVYSLLEASAKALGSDLEINFDENGTKEAAKEAYDKAVDELIAELRSDDTIKQAIADGLFGDDDEVTKILDEHAQEYMRSYHTSLYNAANNLPVIVTRKIAIDIFDELDGEYSLLSDAIEEFSESGMISAKTIRAMTDEFPDLLKYIRQTENGFTLLDTTLDSIMANYWADKAKDFEEPIRAAYEYYNALVNAYDGSVEQYTAINDAYEDLKTALANGVDFITAYNVTIDDLLEEQYTELLEKQRDAIDEQIDAFGELCDIRKELLKTYEDEVNYQRELEKKQQAVTGLQTKLSVARLDQSAAGQARVRELEAELKEAQDELEDFTLEHAIDILTKQIESSNAEFEAMMNNALVRLENAIAGAASMTATALKNAITSLGATPVSSGGNTDITSGVNGAIGDVQSGITGSTTGQLPNSAPVQAPTKAPEPEPEPVVKKEPKKVLSVNSDYSVSGLSGGLTMGKDDITVTIGDHSYNVKVSTSAEGDAVAKELNALYGNSSKTPDNGRVAYYNGHLYITKKGSWRRLVEEDYEQLKNAYTYKMNNYHTGGLVGDISTLSSSEEFAKLLKGEFVSTPAQMKRFMEETLPQIANYSASGSSNEFNAPLIEITCESVTTEALPELERVVNEAVKEIQKQLDSGMSRTGFKRPTTKRLV